MLLRFFAMKKSELMQLLTSGNLAKLPLRQFLKDNKGCEVLNSHKKPNVVS